MRHAPVLGRAKTEEAAAAYENRAHDGAAVACTSGGSQQSKKWILKKFLGNFLFSNIRRKIYIPYTFHYALYKRKELRYCLFNSVGPPA